MLMQKRKRIMIMRQPAITSHSSKKAKFLCTTNQNEKNKKQQQMHAYQQYTNLIQS